MRCAENICTSQKAGALSRRKGKRPMHDLLYRFIQALKDGWQGCCPHCGRWAQVYRRTLHTSVCLQLAALYRADGSMDYVHTSKLLRAGSTGTGDFCKAKYWNLIQSKPDHEQDEKKSSGYWMLTTKGLDFVRHGGFIEKYALIYDDKVIGYKGPMVTFQQCVGKKFNYLELLEGA